VTGNGADCDPEQNIDQSERGDAQRECRGSSLPWVRFPHRTVHCGFDSRPSLVRTQVAEQVNVGPHGGLPEPVGVHDPALRARVQVPPCVLTTSSGFGSKTKPELVACRGPCAHGGTAGLYPAEVGSTPTLGLDNGV